MDHDPKIELTFAPKGQDIDFLTQGINDDSVEKGICEKAYPFAFFIRNSAGELMAGYNGSVVYGVIYTDQLWVHVNQRRQGYGRLLMEKVHQLAIDKQCTMATVSTLSFQDAHHFYHSLGYVCDFERPGYSEGGILYFMKKNLS